MTMISVETRRRWSAQDDSRIPAWIYSDPGLFEREMEVFHQGRTWNYIGLECEVAPAFSWRAGRIGPLPVILARGADQELRVLRAACPACGANTVVRGSEASAVLYCPRHGRQAQLFGSGTDTGDALRHTSRGGAVWATCSAEADEFAEWIGPEATRLLDRVLSGRPLRLLGYDRQLLSCNWKLYIENNRDPYHATLLHTFFTTFGISRADAHHLSAAPQHGRIGINAFNYVGRQQTALADQMKTIRAGFSLEDMETVLPHDEFGDGTYGGLQVFPSILLQFHVNTLAIRHLVPLDVGHSELRWTYFGYADDDGDLQRKRLKHGNLTGPAGYVSIEDSELLALAQDVLAAAPESRMVVRMGGTGIAPEETMVTENQIRGFYALYRREMGFE